MGLQTFVVYSCITLRIASHSSAAHRFVHPSLSLQHSPNPSTTAAVALDLGPAVTSPPATSRTRPRPPPPAKTHGLLGCLQKRAILLFAASFAHFEAWISWGSSLPAWGSSCTCLPLLHWPRAAGAVAGKLGTARHDRRETRWSTTRNQDRPRYMRPGHSHLQLIMIDPPRHIITYPAS